MYVDYYYLDPICWQVWYRTRTSLSALSPVVRYPPPPLDPCQSLWVENLYVCMATRCQHFNSVCDCMVIVVTRSYCTLCDVISGSLWCHIGLCLMSYWTLCEVILHLVWCHIWALFHVISVVEKIRNNVLQIVRLYFACSEIETVIISMLLKRFKAWERYNLLKSDFQKNIRIFQ